MTGPVRNPGSRSRVVQHESVHLLTLEYCGTGGEKELVPVVNGWIQLDFSTRGQPSALERRRHALNVLKLTSQLKRRGRLRSWYFLHKLPGWILRLRSGSSPVALADALIDQAHLLRTGSIRPVRFNSYFAQRALLFGRHDAIVGGILMQSSELALRADRGRRRARPSDWAQFSVSFLTHFLSDRWWVWEALLRLRGLVDSPLSPARHSHGPARLLHPGRLLRQIIGQRVTVPRDFRVSTALLASLNMVFNQWELGEDDRRAVVESALELVRPEIAAP